MAADRDNGMIKIAHVGAAGGLCVRTTGQRDDIDMSVQVQADGVMVGVRNVQRNYLHYQVDHPIVSFDPAVRGAAFTRRFEALLERPTSWVRREQFRQAVAVPPAHRRGQVVFTDSRTGLPGRARVRACAVRVRGSRGVVIGDGNHQTNHLRYRLTRSVIAVESLLRDEPALAYRLADFVAAPDNPVLEHRLVNAMSRILERSQELTRMIAAGSGRTGGVMIGTANRQTTITKSRIRDVDVKAVIVRVRFEALESGARAKLALLDAEDRRDHDELRKIGTAGSLDTGVARRRDELELTRIERAEQCLVLQTERLQRAQRPESPHADRKPAIKAELDSLRKRIDDIKSERGKHGPLAVLRAARTRRLADPTTLGRLSRLEPRAAAIPRWPDIEPVRRQPPSEINPDRLAWPTAPQRRDLDDLPGRGGPAIPGP
ncbi:hypothetical protein FF36_03985 [Frankia torreyi]|uniref:Uncharacterized protein n=2 Tax=Frankiaceae TaxID=74712 RepID=A0A0D8BE13_9ACTN|nr:hypothetical protein FF36_03985 [Frankia torreyi]